MFFFDCSAVQGHLHSFPTRRSSDLTARGPRAARRRVGRGRGRAAAAACEAAAALARAALRGRRAPRSEEHTSELQSHVNLVCRLLLEKKKTRVRPFGF